MTEQFVAFINALLGFLQYHTAGFAVALLVLSFVLILTLLINPTAQRRPLYVLIGAFMTLSAVFLIVAVIYPGDRIDRYIIATHLRDIDQLAAAIATQASADRGFLDSPNCERHVLRNGADNNQANAREIKSLARLALQNLENTK